MSNPASAEKEASEAPAADAAPSASSGSSSPSSPPNPGASAPSPDAEAPVAAAEKSEAPAAEKKPATTALREGTASPFPQKSPLDGSALDPVEASREADVEAAVGRARAAQQIWGATPVRDRAAAIAKLKHVILSRAEPIAELVRKECGKPFEEAALAEVLPNADLIDYWTVAIEELLEATPVELDALSFPGKIGRIVKEPRGVVGLVTPWNYPVAIPLRALVPALLAGNTVVWKPSEITPRSGALVASLFKGIVPEGVVELVQGGGDIGAALVAAEVDAVLFTGSVATGKKIAVACAERLIPCSLELGGKDAAIVLADANLERAARGVVWGAFTNAGQNCASIERVYVEKKVAEKFIDRVVALTKELRPGIDTAMMTTHRQCDTVRRHLDDAIAKGGRVLVGGAPDAGALDFAPTVVRLEDDESQLMRDETFGPILPIVVVENADEAVDRTNASRFGLTTSVWTKRLNYGHELASRLRSGVVTINNHGFTAALPAAPWTGAGDSGFGVTNSPYALGELTRPRFILEDRSGAKSELWWYPYTPTLRTIALAMATARGGGGFFARIGAIFRLLAAFPKRLRGK